MRGKAYRSPVTFWRPWARFTNYLTTVLRSSYNNVTVIIIIKDIYIPSSQGPLMRYVGRDGSMVT